MPDQATVGLSDVSFGYDKQRLFDKLNGTICPNERLVVLGRSGVGKSTLLRLVAGLISPDSGRIDRRAASRDHAFTVGFVFQDHALLPWLTAHENIRLALRLTKAGRMKRSEQDDRIHADAQRLSIEGVLALYPHQLSGGMRQRVALARALVTDPDLLCLDEPFSALDPFLRKSARDAVETAVVASMAATVIVTHDINDALAIADRIWLLVEGAGAGPVTVTEIERGSARWSADWLLQAYSQG